MSRLYDRAKAAVGERYEVVREVGKSGMAVVFAAVDPRHGRRVALKVLLPDVSANLGRERFLREIRIAAGLVHPGILPLLDSGEADGLLYHVTPWVDGETLRTRLSRERHLSVEEAVRITREVAESLHYAHGEGIVHRDVKPENILLAKGHALIVDFGVARAIELVGGERLTETGIVMGTPAYMSPEQVQGRHLDARSDQYALACVTYEMLGGEPPLSGRTAQTIMARRLSESASSLCPLREAVTPAMDAVVRRALSRLPADRFQNLEEYSRALVASETGAVFASPIPGALPGPGTGRDSTQGSVASEPLKLSLWQELKARKVYNVGFVYLASAWVFVEVSGAILEAFDRLEWNRYLILAAVAGFPLALGLAWAFEITRDGVRRTQAVDLRVTQGRRLARLPVLSRGAVVAGLLALVVAILWQLFKRM